MAIHEAEMHDMFDTIIFFLVSLDAAGELFEPTMTLIHAVSNVICSVVFGSRFNYKDKAFLELLDTVTNYINYFNSPIARVCATPLSTHGDISAF